MWRGFSEKVNRVNVYAPIDQTERLLLWSKLLSSKNRKEGVWLLMGDFNEVRRIEDIFSEKVCYSSMEAFSSFISEVGLIDFSMEGGWFTRMSEMGGV